ncbi:ALKBH2 [Symbiodinium natans]|uniref:ALKBH2 protein n=1 Tax=Symbiodinium natans TaxID=878477 RepID=A0A812NTL8_9DINO|nr:ALKBH2 [Symbiodinium natans]
MALVLPSERRIDGLGTGDTSLLLDFLPTDAAADLLAALVPSADFDVRPDDEIQWQKMEYYGMPVPRLVCIQGERQEDGSMPVYRHPVDEQPPIFEFTPTVQRVVEAARAQFGVPFNHALIQLYRSGDDSINVHSDKTLDIAHGTPILNVSLGASREFLIRSKEKVTCGTWAALRQSVVLPHNSALAFGLDTNRVCTHQIMPDRRPDGQRRSDETAFGGVRVSLTLRVVATFQRPDGSLYGQGARQKTAVAKASSAPAASPEEGQRMAEAFRRENVDPCFDWAAYYGEGFDILAPSYTQPARTMSSFSETQMSLADLLAFLWELVVLAHKTALGMLWVQTTHRPALGLQLALAVCASHFTLSLAVQPYRHQGLNVLEACFAFLNVLCVLMSMQMEYFGSNPTFENIVFGLVFAYGTLGVVVFVAWSFFFAWEKTFQETYYVMMSGDCLAQSGKEFSGDDSVKPAAGSMAELRSIPMLTRVVQSCDDLTPSEPRQARWCFNIKAPDALPTARARHGTTHERLDLALEQAMAVTVRTPELLMRILEAEGSEVSFAGFASLGLPRGMAPGCLRRGGDLRGRIRVTVPCADQKLLRTTLRQLGAFSARCSEHPRSDDDEGSKRISTVSSTSAGVDPASFEEATKSRISTASRPSRVSRVSASWPPPSAESAYALEALPRPAKIAGRWVPAGAVLDQIRYVPPGTSIDEAPTEFAETFLARLSRKRFGKGGVLRDSRGELVLEFQRPDDPLDLHTELCELLLSRNEVPGDRAESTLDSPTQRATRM